MFQQYRALAEAIAAAVLVFALVFAVGRFVHHERQIGRDEVQATFDAYKVAQERAAQEQIARNLDMQRQAEKRYTVQAEVRDHYITNTVIEVRHETDNLAACKLTDGAVRLLDSAAACAREDSAAACGTDK
jgi:hypothetical protein